MDLVMNYSSEEENTITALTAQPAQPFQRAASSAIQRVGPPAAQAAAPADKPNVFARMMT